MMRPKTTAYTHSEVERGVFFGIAQTPRLQDSPHLRPNQYRQGNPRDVAGDIKHAESPRLGMYEGL